MKIKILGLFPLQGNGGIASWTKKFLSSFPDEEYSIFPVNIAPDKDFTKFRGLDRYYYGIKSFIRICQDVKETIRKNPDIKIMHITSGGGNGVLRDFKVAQICHKFGLKCVLHCRFGCIQETFEDKGWRGQYFRKSLGEFDQIWVLDRKSESYLKSISRLSDKIFLTPNSIEVPPKCVLSPKTYYKVGFVGNILPKKGIFELTEAVSNLNNETELFIAGIGSEETLEKIRKIAGSKLNRRIKLLGKLPNLEAIKLMETLDIICLPTYYDGEAFPISILEAMSRGKLVISCPRAAIPDMLTAIDGTLCGILVPDKDSKAIADSIEWCQDHNDVADEMCKKAYEKVKTAYRKEVVYEIYRENYRKLLQIDTDSNN